MIASLVTSLQTWAQSVGLDVQHNIIDPLGSELSVQMDWSADTAYPEVGLFVKLDKPDDFKPTITALIESVRKAYEATAEIKEIHVENGPNFAALKFFQNSPITPIITEDGPYLGLFVSENQAVRSFVRDETLELPHNADFIRQIGDKRNGASQIFFVNSPQLLNHAYQTAMPYVSLASMFNKQLGTILKNKTLPPDLTWLAPMGTWSCVMSPDDDGIQGYSVSGVGNQGIFLATSLGGAAAFAQAMGWTAGLNGLIPQPSPSNNPAAPSANSTNTDNQATPPPPMTPDATTNASSPAAMNSAPEATPHVPETTTNDTSASIPPLVPETHSAPVTNSNSDATPPNPEPAKTQ